MSRTMAVLVGALMLSGCVPAQGDSLKEQIAEDPTMRHIVDAGRLRVAVPESPAGIGADPSGSDGLAVEVGSWVADALGVEPVFEVTTTDAILGLIEDGRSDLGFPIMPMTEGSVRSKKRSHTAPYFVAHQRVLLAPGVTDVDGVDRVCVFGDARTQIPVENVDPGWTAIRANDGAACARLMDRGIVRALVAPDVLLFELEARLEGSRILPSEYNTEGYGAIVQFGEIPLANFVDAVISRAVDDGRWSAAYEDNVEPLTEVAVDPPDLTAEEAAALFPRGLDLR